MRLIRPPKQFHNENLPMQYTEIFFSEAKVENFIGTVLIFSILLHKTFIVDTRQNLCFGSKTYDRKGKPQQTKCVCGV